MRQGLSALPIVPEVKRALQPANERARNTGEPGSLKRWVATRTLEKLEGTSPKMSLTRVADMILGFAVSAQASQETSNAGSIFNLQLWHFPQSSESGRDRCRSGTENRDWIINDRPGSFSHHVGKGASTATRDLAGQANTPGKCGAITGHKQNSWFAVSRGVIDGYGWEHNLDHTMA